MKTLNFFIPCENRKFKETKAILNVYKSPHLPALLLPYSSRSSSSWHNHMITCGKNK